MLETTQMHKTTRTVIHLILLAGFCLTLFGDPVHLSNSEHHNCQICSLCILNDHHSHSAECNHGCDVEECENCKNSFSFRGHKLEDRDSNEIFCLSPNLEPVEATNLDDSNELPSFEGKTFLKVPPLISACPASPTGLRAPPVSA
jgi:hypothetical protein